MTPQETPRASRLETILGAMATGVILLSVVCVLLTFFAPTLAGPAAPIVESIPLIGLPIGMLLLIGLTIATIVRRRREQS